MVAPPAKTSVSAVARLVTGKLIVVLAEEDDLTLALDLDPTTGLEAVEVMTVAPRSSVRVSVSFVVSMGISRRTALTKAVVALLADTGTREADLLADTETREAELLPATGTTGETVAHPDATRPEGLLPTQDPHPEDATAVKTLVPHPHAVTAGET